MPPRGRRAGPRLSERARAGARNALEILRLGQLAPAARRPFQWAGEDRHARLRRYSIDDVAGGDRSRPAVLLIPPLMVTADIYDVSSDSSGVGTLATSGVAPFVLDFGAPEREAGGMRRTLDDHVLAVSWAIDRVREITGRAVHLAGYSQGGMFCYQAAAMRRSEGLASIITFGSPVDLHRSVPLVRSEAIGAVTRAIGPSLSRILDRIEGLPAELTSTGFKLITPRKEIEQRIDFLRKLHDRGALERREARRRFLGGEGFVAWPGPALREFVEQFILHNRMLSGGFVVGGRTATLADITCPVLAFLGTTDDLARPAAVRGISRAAPQAEVAFLELRAGHFGLVVGSRANRETWPTVAAWAKWRDGEGPPPAALTPARSAAADEPEEAAFEDVEVDAGLLFETLTAAASRGWRRLGDLAASASDAGLAMRYQVPRLRRLATLAPGDAVSPARALARRAREAPGATFFVWAGRAFSNGDADRRVDAVARGLWSCGVRPGVRVGVWMGSRPSFLTAVTALSRIGAVAVIAPPRAASDVVLEAFRRAGTTRLLADPQRAQPLAQQAAREQATDGTHGEVLVLGGGGVPRALSAGLRDMEAIDPSTLAWPAGFTPDAGRARDPLMILLRERSAAADGPLAPTSITNHRWALSAIGAAGACTLRPEDTVASFLPMHHPTTLLVAVGAALMGGCRLALGQLSPASLFSADDDRAARDAMAEIRRAGATVVFYAGDLVRGLLRAPAHEDARAFPVRLFAGSGMRRATWREVERRWGAGVMEFYASTSLRLIVANASGEKRGALGRPLPGCAATAVVKLEPSLPRALDARPAGLVRADREENGRLIVAVDPAEANARAALELPVLEDVFVPGDRWAPTNDVVRMDRDGDLWLVDTVGGLLPPGRGATGVRAVESLLLEDSSVELAVAFRDESKGPLRIGAAVALERGASWSSFAARLRGGLLGREVDYVRITRALPMSEGFKIQPAAVARLGDTPREGDVIVVLDRLAAGGREEDAPS